MLLNFSLGTLMNHVLGSIDTMKKNEPQMNIFFVQKGLQFSGSDRCGSVFQQNVSKEK